MILTQIRKSQDEIQLTAPNAARNLTASKLFKMKDIQVSARLKIKPGKLDEFKKLAQDCVEMVKQKDKGTIQYDWFYNESRSECVVRERYVDSEAVLDHMANVGHLLGVLVELSTISLDMYGNPSDNLINALEGFDVTYYDFGVGL